MTQPIATPEEPGHIMLRSLCGPFNPDFIRGLRKLEMQMVLKGLDPSVFTIEKNSYTSNVLAAAYPLAVPASYTYVVFVREESFSIVQYDDMFFLTYFAGLCLNENTGHPSGKSLLERCMDWLRKDSV